MRPARHARSNSGEKTSLETYHTRWYRLSVVHCIFLKEADMWFSRRAGWLLAGIGLIHCCIGLLLSWDIFVAWQSNGWWHSIESAHGLRMDRFAALWFQVSGFSWVLLGWLMQQWLNRTGALPQGLGWALVAMGLLVAWVLPLSGAWLFLPVGLLVAKPSNPATQRA